MAAIDKLSTIVARRKPELNGLVDQVRTGTMDPSGVEALQSVIVDELLEFGLDPSDEHTDYGRELETLIDLVNRASPAYLRE